MMNSRDEMFFDSFDYLLPEDCAGSLNQVPGCEFWRNELKSVKERRNMFFRDMGFIEFGDSGNDQESLNASIEMGSDRICESDGVMLDSCASSTDNSVGVGSVVSCGREKIGNANCMIDELGHEQSDQSSSGYGGDNAADSSSGVEEDECQKISSDEDSKLRNWWRQIISRRRGTIKRCSSTERCDVLSDSSVMRRIKTKVNKKRFKELSALYIGQEIQAHKGYIRKMKFSPDGQYLATGGQDGVVRVWRVTSVAAYEKSFSHKSNSFGSKKKGSPDLRREKKDDVPVVIPDKIFQFEEKPFQEFHGHNGDILDLDWSSSNCLLSSSTDKTVRMWQVGSDKCLNMFHHFDYVTCLQFNPVDDGQFISGSVDGKVRIWGILERRVLDWVDIRDAITVITYWPDGKGFLVGSVAGTCQFYEPSGDCLQPIAHIPAQGSKNLSRNAITGIQLAQEDPRRVIVTSEDSKVRIFDWTDVVHKYRGLLNSGSQMSASVTSNGKHIISIGEDSRIYMWNHDPQELPPSRHPKSVRSCEHFRCEGVSVSVAWPSGSTDSSDKCGSSTKAWGKIGTARKCQDSQGLSFGGSALFSMKGSCMGNNFTATWPAEILPSLDLNQQKEVESSNTAVSAAWGLVIVTASCDGIIRTFHNYGLPLGF